MSEQVVYLTELECRECGERQTFAHRDRWVPLDQAPPWPSVNRCPMCGELYPRDRAVVITDITEAELTHPRERGESV